MKATGAQILSKALASAGVQYIAGIPGHTVFPFANVVSEDLSPVLVRSEAISTFAADAYFRLTGRLMAVFAHSVPGTSNLAAGLANAYADSSALLLIAGETAREALGRGAYQELARQFDGDVSGFVRHLTKKSWLAHSPQQLVEQAFRAVRLAKLGRPGPVALHVFQDVWEQEIEIPGWPDFTGYNVGNAFRPSEDSVSRAAALIAGSTRPLIVAGGGVKTAHAHEELRALAELIDAPVVTSVTGKGAIDETDPRALGVVGWVGTSAANAAGRDADLILAFGSRMTETTTSSWQPGTSFGFGSAKLIQNDVDPDQIANVIPVDVALVGDCRLTLADLLAVCQETKHQEWMTQVRARREEWELMVADAPGAKNGVIQGSAVVRELRAATTGRPAVLVGDVGKSHKWAAQQFQVHAGDDVLSTMGAGTMGFGPCGAVGAALGRPDSHIISWSGDGGLSMSSYVLPTAAEHALPIKFVVLDDGAFGEVANIQEDRYGRTVFSEFNGSGANPQYRLDLARLAEASGVPARRVEHLSDLAEAFKWAIGEPGPALLDIVVDRRSRVPSGGGTKLPKIWEHPIHPWAPLS